MRLFVFSGKSLRYSAEMGLSKPLGLTPTTAHFNWWMVSSAVLPMIYPGTPSLATVPITMMSVSSDVVVAAISLLG